MNPPVIDALALLAAGARFAAALSAGTEDPDVDLPLRSLISAILAGESAPEVLYYLANFAGLSLIREAGNGSLEGVLDEIVSAVLETEDEVA